MILTLKKVYSKYLNNKILFFEILKIKTITKNNLN